MYLQQGCVIWQYHVDLDKQNTMEQNRDNPGQGDTIKLNMKQSCCFHSIFDHFPITAHPEVFIPLIPLQFYNDSFSFINNCHIVRFNRLYLHLMLWNNHETHQLLLSLLLLLRYSSYKQPFCSQPPISLSLEIYIFKNASCQPQSLNSF